MGTKGLGALRQGSVKRSRSAAKNRGCESWPTGHLGRAVLATLMVMVGLTSAVQAAATAPAGATSACTSAAFDDTFTTDTALSSCWQTGTPVISSFESKIGATNAAPQLSFGNGMEMSGAAGVNQFSAIQSATAYSAPFTFSVTALQLGAGGDEPFSYGSGLGIYLVNSSLSQAFSVEANFNPDAGSNYGIWANNGLTADGTGKKVYASPSASNPYEITMSVDGSGNATVSVTIPFQSGTGVQYTIGNVGTGPFYLMLGQDEGTPNAQVLSDQASFPESANLTDWESAKLNYCSTTSLVRRLFRRPGPLELLGDGHLRDQHGGVRPRRQPRACPASVRQQLRSFVRRLHGHGGHQRQQPVRRHPIGQRLPGPVPVRYERGGHKQRPRRYLMGRMACEQRLPHPYLLAPDERRRPRRRLWPLRQQPAVRRAVL